MFNLLSMLSQSICRSWFAAVVLTPLSWAADTGPAWWHDIFHFVLIVSFFFLCVAWDRTETAPSPRALSDFPSRRALEHVVHSEAQGLLSLNLCLCFPFDYVYYFTPSCVYVRGKVLWVFSPYQASFPFCPFVLPTLCPFAIAYLSPVFDHVTDSRFWFVWLIS